MSKLAIEQAFTQFDQAFHDLKAVVQAVTWISARGLRDADAHEAADEGAFGIIWGLNNLAERLMEQSLFKAAVDQKHVALEHIETREVSAPRRARSAEHSSSATEVA